MTKSLLWLFLMGLCGVVSAAPRATDTIWRAQLMVTVANLENAGTDDEVRVVVPNASETFIDTSLDDFERGVTYKYDLRIENLRTIGTLMNQGFIISKEGADGLGLARVTLLINDRSVFTHTFPNGVFWLDRAPTLPLVFVVTPAMLQSNASWLNYTQPEPPNPMRNSEIRERTEALFGDLLVRWRRAGGTPYQWGKRFNYQFTEITAAPGSATKLRGDLDWKREDTITFDEEVDIDFEYTITCNKGRLEFLTSNFLVMIGGLTSQDIIVNDHDGPHALRSFLSQQFPKLTSTFASCPAFQVNSLGEVALSFTAVPDWTGTLGLLTKTMTPQLVSLAMPGEIITPEPTPALAVRFDAGQAGVVGEYQPFIVEVKANDEKASEAQVQIALPHGVISNGAFVTVADEQGTHVSEAQLTTSETGATLLTFSDVLAADETRRYTVQLWFGEQPAGETFVTTTVNGKVLAAPVVSRTSFNVANGKVQPQGTVQFVGQKNAGVEVGHPRQ